MMAWHDLLTVVADAFTRPGLALFVELLTGWVLCPGRRTVTGMLRPLGPERCRAHDAYHRFIREGAWNALDLWKGFVPHLVDRWCHLDPIICALDDTLLPKSGRKIDGAGYWHDAVRSTKTKPVIALGLNVVVLCVVVTLPWAPVRVGLPVNLRLHRKDDARTLLDLAEEMMRALAEWLPQRRFLLVADGAYASLAARHLPRTEIRSRLRSDAALYDLPAPRRPGQRGRPALRGPRLPRPTEMAADPHAQWQHVTCDIRGHSVERRLLCRRVLWYAVCGSRPILLVIVRDPTGLQRDDFFFSTNADALPTDVVASYADRWAIEVTFRDAKQLLRAAQPQSWKYAGPTRIAHLAFWLYSAVWTWYLLSGNTPRLRTATPWYTAKWAPAFTDALAALRHTLWTERISPTSLQSADLPKIAAVMVEMLADVA